MPAVLRVQTETEKPGIVTVEAFCPGIDNQAALGNAGSHAVNGQTAGFLVRRRKHGERFKIADWREFSPRWMRFVDDPPKDWLKHIGVREEDRASVMAKADQENKLTPQELLMRQMFSMSQAMNPTKATIEHSTGRIKDTI